MLWWFWPLQYEILIEKCIKLKRTKFVQSFYNILVSTISPNVTIVTVIKKLLIGQDVKVIIVSVNIVSYRIHDKN